MLDVAVVGAGLSGLICAQQLRRSNYRVALIDKSRGLGGRLATRRLQNTCADHGVRYLDEQGDRTRELIKLLGDPVLQAHESPKLRDRLLQSWIDTEYKLNGALQPTAPHPRYIATNGMTAIAKALAAKLDIHRSLRVVRLSANQTWTLICETGETFEARSIVLAIPAPQAVTLLESIDPLPTDLLDRVRLVEFDSCLTVIATYPARYQAEVEALLWRAIEVHDDDFAWIGIDSSKRPNSAAPVIVIHSSPEFASRFLEAELQPIAKQLLECASSLLPWLNQPEMMQIHRWRYAFARQALGFVPSAVDPLPIVCCGDWCMGTNVEAALRSGEAAATAMHELLEGCQSATHSLATLNFAEMIDAP